jgi:ADP-sugar diphosphatase
MPDGAVGKILAAAAELAFPSLAAVVNLPSLDAFRAFQQWTSRLSRNLQSQSNESHAFHSDPYKLRSVNIQARDMFGSKIGFLKLSATVTSGEGESLGGAIFLRGPSVAMMV